MAGDDGSGHVLEVRTGVREMIEKRRDGTQGLPNTPGRSDLREMVDSRASERNCCELPNFPWREQRRAVWGRRVGLRLSWDGIWVL